MKMFCCFILAFFSFLPQFANASENVLRERIYAQTDKQLYLAGELIWIKLITTDIQGKPIDFSKVGYVELISDEGSPKAQAKIEIAGGVGEGYIFLPTTLETGSYRLVAYTRYMLNEGEDVFFSKIIPVINTFTLDKAVDKIADSAHTDSYHAQAVSGEFGLKTDRTTYPVRTSGNVYLDGLPDNIHTLSVTIAGYQPIVRVDDSGISAWHNNQRSDKKNTSFKGNVIPEYEGHIITGKIINLATKQPATEQGILPLLSFQGDQIRLFLGDQRQDTVIYYTKRISGMHDVSTSAYSPSSTRYRIDILSPFIQHRTHQLPALQINTAMNDWLIKRSIGLQALNAYTADSLSQLEYQDALLQWKPTKKYVLYHYNRFDTMGETITEFIMELRFRRFNGKRFLIVADAEGVLTNFSVGNSLVLLDGIPIVDHEYIYGYNPRMVKEIDVYTGRYILGGKIFDGLVSFKTFNNDYPDLVVGEETQIFQYEGTQAHRRFYAPSYQTDEEKKSRTPDFRHTLFWNSHINTQGKSSVAIPFTTSDLTGDFIVTVEGIGKDGEIISAEARIKVE